MAKEEKVQAAEQWRQYDPHLESVSYSSLQLRFVLQQTAAVFESEKKQADDEYDVRIH